MADLTYQQAVIHRPPKKKRLKTPFYVWGRKTRRRLFEGGPVRSSPFAVLLYPPLIPPPPTTHTCTQYGLMSTMGPRDLLSLQSGALRVSFLQKCSSRKTKGKFYENLSQKLNGYFCSSVQNTKINSMQIISVLCQPF